MSDRSTTPLLGLSVFWGYAFGVILMLFILTILVPDSDGPSPWDPVAFRAGMIEMIANFRILDELADLSIVKVADVGDGVLTVDLEQIAVSNRRFGYAPFVLAIVFAVLCLFLRAVRLRVLARHGSIPSEVKGQLSAFFFGRGLNLFFPFGPGELGATQTLTAHGAAPEAAALAVFHNRVFEVLALAGVLLAGFVYLGWGGAVGPFVWTVVLIAGVVSLTRPFGRGRSDGSARLFGDIRGTFRRDAVTRATADLLRTPGFFLGVLLLSLVTFGLEVLAFWNIKQAFSAPLDDYVLMKDLPLVPFTVVVAVAGLARVIPYTFAGFGIIELVTVVMFRAFGEGFLGGTTVALLSALLINGTAFLLFLLAMAIGRCPSVLEVWHLFFDRSVARARLTASTSA
jgi:hypothetical protein